MLWEFLSSTYPGEVALEEQGYRTLWNAIGNSAVPLIDEKDWNKRMARYTLNKELLVKHMEDGRPWISKWCAAMDVWT